MPKDMPPAVTKKSPKKDLWKELECARAEIDDQQRMLNSRNEQLRKALDEAGSLRYMMQVIRAAVAGEVRQG